LREKNFLIDIYRVLWFVMVVCSKIQALLDVVLRTMEQLDINFHRQLQRKNNHSKHPCSELLVRNTGSRE